MSYTDFNQVEKRMRKYILPEGSVVHVGGFPVRLTAPAEVESETPIDVGATGDEPESPSEG